VNGDGLPDLFTTDHGNDHLWINNGDGTFTNVTGTDLLRPSYLPGAYWGDSHGSAFVMNNGTLELLVLTGAEQGVGQNYKQLFIENDGVLSSPLSNAAGIDDYAQRSRMPTFFMLKGKLAVFTGAIARPDGTAPPALYVEGDNGRFTIDQQGALGLILSAPTMISADLNGDGQDELIGVVGVMGANGQVTEKLMVIDFSSGTPTALDQNDFRNLQVDARETVLVADFNGDGRPDILCLPGNSNNPDNTTQLPAILLLNTGNGFADASAGSGLTIAPGVRVGSAVVGDFNNDGRVDIFAFNNLNGPHGDPTDALTTANTLYVNNGNGTGTAQVSDVLAPATGEPRSVTTVDVNQDGNLDLDLTTSFAPNMLYENTANDNAWIEIQGNRVNRRRDKQRQC